MNQEQNNINLKSQGSNGVPNNSSLNSNKIMGYDSQTGALLYGTNNINNQVQNVRYATFWERLGATFRDVLQIWWFAVLGFCLMTILRVGLDASGMGESSFYTTLGLFQVAGPILFMILGQPIYALFGDASNKHATKGKLKRNMVVLNKQGNYLTFGQSFLRMLLKYITLCFPFGLIVTIIVMCCTEKKQSLHDLILGHVVVKKNL